MKRFSLRYTLLTSRFDQLWFPLAFWALFVVIGILRGPEYILDTSRAYLGAVVPLISGIMAAYAVLDDPALELRFATPIPAAQTLLERLMPTFIIQVLCALTYQVFAITLGVDFLSTFGNWINVQWIWLIPTLSLMALGCFCAIAAAQTATGALLVGMVWIVELVARGWFAYNAGKYFLVFMGPLMPDHPDLFANYISLTALTVAFLFIAWALLHRQERFI
ncbi:MAG TPA: hypothetical protein VLE49_01160 [Anaerolineales bacterium]|nr:hypothetical protein [Anaerolineales bacterium]